MAVDDGIGFLVRPRVRVSVGADDGMSVGSGSSLLAGPRVGVSFGTDDDMAVGNGSGLVVGPSVGASLGTEDGVVLGNGSGLTMVSVGTAVSVGTGVCVGTSVSVGAGVTDGTGVSVGVAVFSASVGSCSETATSVGCRISVPPQATKMALITTRTASLAEVRMVFTVLLASLTVPRSLVYNAHL